MKFMTSDSAVRPVDRLVIPVYNKVSAAPAAWGVIDRRSAFILAAFLAAAAAIQLWLSTGSDVSWLLLLSDAVLSGKRLYVDILETNPPASALLYFAPTLIARATGIAAEFILIVLVIAAAAAALSLTDRILAPTCSTKDRRLFHTGALFVLLILPFGSFAQREHIALISVLPMLGVAVARAEGRTVALATAALAGFGGGVAMAIKPHFALAILLPYVFVAWRTRTLRSLFGAEILFAATIVLAYAAVVLLVFPDFIGVMLPIVRDTYLQGRLPLTQLLIMKGGNTYVIALLTVFFLMSSRKSWSPRATVLLLASAGFFLDYLEQAKGWPYHVYPATALVMLVLLLEVWPVAVAGVRDSAGSTRRIALMIVAIAVLTAWQACYEFAVRNFDPIPLAKAAARGAPMHPSVLAIGNDLAVGHPLTRMLGGSWAGTTASEWITDNASLRMAAAPNDMKLRARMLGWIEKDRAMLAADLRRNRPDIVLVDQRYWNWLAWINANRDAAEAMAQYRFVAKVEGVEIYHRYRDALAPRS